MSLSPELQRRDLIERELSAYNELSVKPTYTLTLRGVRQTLKVIRVNPSALLFNPKNSRIWAQVHAHQLRDEVIEHPDSRRAQEVIVELLRGTEKYANLKAELKELGQQNPGVITRDGLLVNGNTRAAALIELGETGIDVAVLPTNTTQEDLLSVEMALQMTQLTHQDYSFTNQLLMMRRYLDSGKSALELAKEMAWLRRGERKVKEHMRYLDYIEEIRELSTVPIAYDIFDKKKEHLKNLDDDYQRVRVEDPSAAEDLKWTRLTGLILGINKDQIRAMDEDFVEEDLKVRLDDPELAEFLEPYKKHNKEVDGLDELLGVREEGSPYDMKQVLIAALKDDDLRFVDGETPLGLPDELQKLQRVMRDAADDKIISKKRSDYLSNPIDTLQEIRSKIDEVDGKFVDVVDLPGFKNGSFRYQLKKLAEQVDALMKKCDTAG